MLLAKTPLRINFMGGMTDYPEFFKVDDHFGCTLSTTIDKFVYLTLLEQPLFEKTRFKFQYRETEEVIDISDFRNKIVREVLKSLDWDKPISISTTADLPGRSGLGSSSSFVVSLIGILNAHLENGFTKRQLVDSAIEIERNILNEFGGYQDQFTAGIGGFRFYEYSKSKIAYSKNMIDSEFGIFLNKCIVLIANQNIQRDSFEYAKIVRDQIMNNFKNSSILLNEIAQLTKQTYKFLNSDTKNLVKLEHLAHGVNESNKVKSIFLKDSYSNIDEIIRIGLRNGALAGKLCGAGGSGFVLFLVAPDRLENFLKNYDKNLVILPNFEKQGIRIKRT
jgi:D-glycero-alpha-D-manno-heptose-7-phosphate kinase